MDNSKYKLRQAEENAKASAKRLAESFEETMAGHAEYVIQLPGGTYKVEVSKLPS